MATISYTPSMILTGSDTPQARTFPTGNNGSYFLACTMPIKTGEGPKAAGKSVTMLTAIALICLWEI